MFIAASFTKAKTWKQCKCPLTDEWIKNMWCIYIYIFNAHINIHSAIKKMTIMPYFMALNELG